MITIKDIKENAKNHPLGSGKIVRYGNDFLLFSVVGGADSLYGDFEETFEVAIFDKKTNEFVTNYLLSDSNNGVVGWMSGDELVRISNEFLEKGFQFDL